MPARHVVHVDDSGVVTFDEVLHQLASLRADPNFSPDFDEIVDMSGASDVRLGYDEFKRMDLLDPFPETSKQAIVIPTNPAVYGVTRMYHLIQNEDPTIKIFRTEQEAREWVKNPG